MSKSWSFNRPLKPELLVMMSDARLDLHRHVLVANLVLEHFHRSVKLMLCHL